jgi:hypothetical protein
MAGLLQLIGQYTICVNISYELPGQGIQVDIATSENYRYALTLKLLWLIHYGG